MIGALTIHPGSRQWYRPAMAGFMVIALAFGALGLWSATAKIDSAVVAPGVVSIETSSKIVQHLEGGIIRQVLVQEGQHVEQGQVLLRLDNVQAKATADTYRNQLLGARVLEARLIAERDDRPDIQVPPDIQALAATPVVAKFVADQEAQFTDRRNSLRNEIGIVKAQIEGLYTEIEGLRIEQISTDKQIGYINQELTGLRSLLAQKLVPLDRVLAMERERTRLEAVVGRLIADQAHARNSIGERQLQIEELRHKFQEGTAAAIAEVRQKIADLREKLKIAQDVLRRTEIRSPVSGTVQGVKIFSRGQVIGPGQTLMEVVPDDENLIIRAQFSPNDIAHVHAGQQAEVRFPSFHAGTTPVILGHLASVSHDLLTNAANHQPFYLGLVMVNRLDIPPQLKDRLRAGMPAEVIVSGGYRSVLNYLIAPLTNAWRTSFRQ